MRETTNANIIPLKYFLLDRILVTLSKLTRIEGQAESHVRRYALEIFVEIAICRVVLTLHRHK